MAKNILVAVFSASGVTKKVGEEIARIAGDGTWLAGERFSGSVSEEDLKSWIDGLQ